MEQLQQTERAGCANVKALAIQVKAMGPDHADVGRTLYNMAIVAKKTENYEKALELYGRAVDCYTQAYGAAEHIKKLIAVGKVAEMRNKINSKFVQKVDCLSTSTD